MALNPSKHRNFEQLALKELNTRCTKLLHVGASLCDVDHDGLDAMSWAATGGHLHCVELMLNRGCDIDHNDKIKRTPLHLASLYGHEQVV